MGSAGTLASLESAMTVLEMVCTSRVVSAKRIGRMRVPMVGATWARERRPRASETEAMCATV